MRTGKESDAVGNSGNGMKSGLSRKFNRNEQRRNGNAQLGMGKRNQASEAQIVQAGRPLVSDSWAGTAAYAAKQWQWSPPR